ncbi:MAG: ATP-grasp domain-containing protein [Candidatus Saccharimonadales bacterium]
MEQQKPRILVLSSAESTHPDRMELNDQFIADLRQRIGDTVELEWHNYHDICMEFQTGSIMAYLRSSGVHLKDFDFVYFKSYFRYSEFAGAIATYLDAQDTPYVCSELRGHIALSKLTQFARMAVAGLPIAKTLYMLSDGFAESYDKVAENLGIPFIFKASDGSTGEQNYRINDQAEFRVAIAECPGVTFVAQSFIQNDSDLRVLIVDKKIQLVIKRQRKDDSTHLNNTSQGADAYLVPIDELSPKDQEISLRAAEVMGRETAGVDLLFESGTGDPYILEVNASPQIASGAFMKEKLDIYSNYFKNVLK